MQNNLELPSVPAVQMLFKDFLVLALVVILLVAEFGMYIWSTEIAYFLP